MADVTKVDVLQIDTSQSVRSIADLKKEIKDLKGQLLSLNEGTEEYSQTLAKLGDDMHQLKEIQEKASMTNQDLGTNISNATKAMSGMAGAVGAVTSALSLMGVQVGDDTKLMKTLMQLMSISQGLAAFEAGAKSALALAKNISTAMKSQKLFNQTALANPYLLLGAAIVAAIVAVTNAIKSQREEEEKRHREAMANIKAEEDARKAYAAQWMQSADEFYVAFARLSEKAQEEEKKKAQEQIEDARTLIGINDRRYAREKKHLDDVAAQEKKVAFIREQYDKDPNKYRQTLQAQEAILEKMQNAAIGGSKAMEDYIKNNNKYVEQLDTNKAKVEALNKLQKEGIHGQEEATKTLTDTQKKVYTEYERQLNAIKLLEAAGEDKLTIAEMNLKVETEYLGTLQKGTREYDTQLTKVAGLHTQIADLTNQEKERTKQLQQQNIEQEKQNKDGENELKNIQREIDLLQTLMNMAQGDDKSYEGIQAQADQQLGYAKLVYDTKMTNLTDEYNAEQDYYNNLLKLYEGDAEKQEEIRRQMELSKEKYRLGQLQAEKEYSDKVTEINKEKNEKKLAQDLAYANFAADMVNKLGGVLDAFSDLYEENTKGQKNLQVASAILTTLGGSVTAFTSALATYGATPAGFAIGAAAAATTLAMGFAQVAKMKSTKVSKSSSANVSNVTVQSIATPTSNVRQLEPQYTDEGQFEEIATTSSDQRVVLVYSDLEAADSQRVSVDSSNAM